MKWLVVILALTLSLHTCIHHGRERMLSAGKPPSPPPQMKDTTARLSFENDIVPIFKSNCTPCHFPGGKMYDRMPFDQLQTIKNHREGILRRMKEKPDGEKIRTFIETLK